MANLKLDLVNNLNNQKYYDEIELIRLAQDPNAVYKDKIVAMEVQLEKIALVNAKIGLVDQYFKEPEAPAGQAATPKQQPEVKQQPQGQVHKNQSHGE